MGPVVESSVGDVTCLCVCVSFSLVQFNWTPSGGPLIFSHLDSKSLSLFTVLPSLQVYTVYVAKWLNCRAISYSNTALSVEMSKLSPDDYSSCTPCTNKGELNVPVIFETIRSALFSRKSGLFIQYKQPPTVRWMRGSKMWWSKGIKTAAKNRVYVRP